RTEERRIVPPTTSNGPSHASRHRRRNHRGLPRGQDHERVRLWDFDGPRFGPDRRNLRSVCPRPPWNWRFGNHRWDSGRHVRRRGFDLDRAVGPVESRNGLIADQLVVIDYLVIPSPTSLTLLRASSSRDLGAAPRSLAALGMTMDRLN